MILENLSAVSGDGGMDIRELFFLARVEAGRSNKGPSKYLPLDGVSDGLRSCYELQEQTAESKRIFNALPRYGVGSGIICRLTVLIGRCPDVLFDHTSQLLTIFMSVVSRPAAPWSDTVFQNAMHINSAIPAIPAPYGTRLFITV
jgi:hypothetical protein